MESIEDRLKYSRKKAGLSQKALSERLGITQRTLQRYEKDATSLTVNVATKISFLCKIDLLWLLTGKASITESTPLKQSTIAEHQDLIKDFKDPGKAKEFNRFLVTVERHNPDGYDSLYGLAKNLYQATPEGQAAKKTRKIRQGPRQPSPSTQKKRANGN